MRGLSQRVTTLTRRSVGTSRRRAGGGVSGEGAVAVPGARFGPRKKKKKRERFNYPVSTTPGSFIYAPVV